MPLILNGSTGISGTDGSAGTPAVQGTDGNTGMFFPAADQIAFAEGGVEAMRLDASGNVGIGTSSPGGYKLNVNGSLYLADSATLANNKTIGWESGSYSYSLTDGTILTVVSGTERMRLDTSGNLRFNSGYGSVATAYGCRAWVNFNGVGTVAIRASGNVSSISDNGLGDYTVNFSTAMTDANYSVAGFAANNGNDENETFTLSAGSTTTYSTTALRVWTTESYGGVTADADSPHVSVVIFR